jgi:hypothetical protein
MCIYYQRDCENQERQERENRRIKLAVKTEVERLMARATCGECGNPVVVQRSNDDGLSISLCEKCTGPTLEIDPAFLQALVGMDVAVSNINSLTKQINGNGRR